MIYELCNGFYNLETKFIQKITFKFYKSLSNLKVYFWLYNNKYFFIKENLVFQNIILSRLHILKVKINSQINISDCVIKIVKFEKNFKSKSKFEF